MRCKPPALLGCIYKGVILGVNSKVFNKKSSARRAKSSGNFAKMLLGEKMKNRFNGYNPQKPELVGLTDCVEAMSDRATSVLVMLMKQYTADEDSLIWSSLDSVLQEVRDIKSVVTGYHDFVELSDDPDETA